MLHGGCKRVQSAAWGQNMLHGGGKGCCMGAKDSEFGEPHCHPPASVGCTHLPSPPAAAGPAPPAPPCSAAGPPAPPAAPAAAPAALPSPPATPPAPAVPPPAPPGMGWDGVGGTPTVTPKAKSTLMSPHPRVLAPTCRARRSSSPAARALWSCSSRSWTPVPSAKAVALGAASFEPLSANAALNRSIASCRAPARCSLSASYTPKTIAK